MTDVIIAHRAGGDKYCFEIYFNGSGSPWILAAFSVVCIPILAMHLLGEWSEPT